MIVTEPLVYEDEQGNTFEGTVSWDDASTEPRPGVMVTSTFMGQSAFETEKAELLAALGYVGFAIDVYGQGRRATSPAEAADLMAELDQDRELLSQRMTLALKTIRELPRVDADRIAAIGFCFGGKCVLDLARSGADVKGVVSFHGIYDPPSMRGSAEISAAVLVLHGWEDPLSPREQTVMLADELTQKGADWQIHMYGHTAHAFTNPKAQAKADGMFFVPKAAERGWQVMKSFLAETLQENAIG